MSARRGTLTPDPSNCPHPNPSPTAMGEELLAAALGSLLPAPRGLGEEKGRG